MARTNPLKAKAGREFLPNTSMKYLEKLYKEEKNVRKRDRLRAYMYRKECMALEDIAHNLKRAPSTIYNWIERAQEEGIRARHEREGRGRECFLDEDQLKQLVADLKKDPGQSGFESGAWNANLARMHVKKKFGAEYTQIGMQCLVTRLGFSWKKGRPKNPGAASKKKQEEFKENAKRLVNEMAEKGFTALAGDEAGLQNAQNRPGYGWYWRSRRAVSRSYLTREGKHIFGVLAVGAFFYAFYDKPNADNYVDFLKRVHKRFGKVLIFVDNASYHKSAKVKKFLESRNGEIVLEYLPPYTPELNPVEVQWMVIKRTLSNKIYKSVNDMTRSVRAMFRKKEIAPVKTFDYLHADHAPPRGAAGRFEPRDGRKSRSAPGPRARFVAVARLTGGRRARRRRVVRRFVFQT